MTVAPRGVQVARANRGLPITKPRPLLRNEGQRRLPDHAEAGAPALLPPQPQHRAQRALKAMRLAADRGLIT